MDLINVKNKVIEISENTDLSNLLYESELAFSENRIPRIIHFCFLDYENMSDAHLSYLSTWFTILNDNWIFVNWTPIISPVVCEFESYVLQENKFAFYSDYMRVKKVWEYGGFYMDCDVIMYKNFEPLLDLNYVVGTEFEKPFVEPAIFGAKKHNYFIKMIKDKYEISTQKEYEKCCTNFLAPLFWRNTLGLNGVTMDPNTFDNIENYRNKVNVENLRIMYMLNSSFLCCPPIKSTWTGIQSEPNENTFTSHMYASTWSY